MLSPNTQGETLGPESVYSLFYCTSASRSRTCRLAESNCASNKDLTVRYGSKLELVIGIEPTTSLLQVRPSTN